MGLFETNGKGRDFRWTLKKYPEGIDLTWEKLIQVCLKKQFAIVTRSLLSIKAIALKCENQAIIYPLFV